MTHSLGAGNLKRQVVFYRRKRSHRKDRLDGRIDLSPQERSRGLTDEKLSRLDCGGRALLRVAVAARSGMAAKSRQSIAPTACIARPVRFRLWQ